MLWLLPRVVLLNLRVYFKCGSCDFSLSFLMTKVIRKRKRKVIEATSGIAGNVVPGVSFLL